MGGRRYTQCSHVHRLPITASLDGDLFAVMADSAPVMIWMADADGHRTFFNRPWHDFTGRSVDNRSARDWTESVHPDDRAACAEATRGAFGERRPFQIEYRLQRFDGEYRWVIDRGAPQLDAGRRFTGYVGAC